jgi:hypothetical protein
MGKNRSTVSTQDAGLSPLAPTVNYGGFLFAVPEVSAGGDKMRACGPRDPAV